jgi:pimeloyl-ACP methyl ester carboxylesterase
MHREKPSYIDANGYKLEYAWLGPSPDQAPTIVFLHEGLGCIAIWGDFPARVAEATGFGALVYTRAGYGNSDPSTLPWPKTFMHDEALVVLPQVLEKLQVRKAILLGHSDGGSIALIHTGGVNADIVQGLIVEAPHVFVEDVSIQGIQAAKTDYEQGTLKKSLERYHGNNVEVAFRGWNDVWLNPAFRSWNIEEFLPNIKVPVLVIQGHDDEYGTLEQVKAIQRGVSGSVETLILENCGHDPHRDQTELVLERATTFIKATLAIE